MEERTFGPIRFIPGLNKARYPYCNSLYIEGSGVLIDPASNRERLSQLKHSPGVRSIWLSHYHDDHLLHLDLFDDLPLWMSDLDAPPLTDLELYLDWGGAEDIEDFREYWRKYYMEQLHFRPRIPTGILRGGDQIRLSDVTVDIIHSPGHTPGHLAFFFKEPEVLFLGDYDLTGFGPMCGEPNASVSETIKSIHYLRTIPAKVWLTSHGKGIFMEDPNNLWDQYLQKIEEREEKILSFLGQPRTFEEIVDAGIVYGRPNLPRAHYVLAEWWLMRKHLEHLIENSRVKKVGDVFVRI